MVEDDELRLLLVDDDEADGFMLEKLLGASRGSFDIERVDRLSAALERAAEADLILLDLFLPDSRGLETFFRLYDAVPFVPIVVMSGLDDEEAAVRAVNEGAEDFLVKGRIEEDALARSLRYAVERHRAKEQLRRLALVDELTGLHNRRGLMTLGGHEFKLSARTGARLVLIFIDVDRMKHINDSYGHQEGDRALRDVSEILRNTFRETDIVARIGGDEFCVLLTGHTEDDGAITTARLKQNVDAHNATKDRRYRLSLSVGVEVHEPGHPAILEELIERADRAMYEQKHGKKGRRRLLVVDDDPDIGALVQKIFLDDYEVVAACTGEDALGVVGAENLDAVLVDLGLPDMMGMDLVRRLRSRERTATTPILVVTGASGSSELESFTAGADDYVQKPFDPHALKMRVNNLVRRASRR